MAQINGALEEDIEADVAYPDLNHVKETYNEDSNTNEAEAGTTPPKDLAKIDLSFLGIYPA